jgi:hypothetical protein
MLAGVVEGPGAVTVRVPPGEAARARALAASERPGHMKIIRGVPE